MRTDRDTIIGATATALVDEVMSTHAQWSFEDESINDGYHWSPTTTAL